MQGGTFPVKKIDCRRSSMDGRRPDGLYGYVYAARLYRRPAAAMIKMLTEFMDDDDAASAIHQARQTTPFFDDDADQRTRSEGVLKQRSLRAGLATMPRCTVAIGKLSTRRRRRWASASQSYAWSRCNGAGRSLDRSSWHPRP